jgi:HrpA-like RNA helicase
MGRKIAALPLSPQLGRVLIAGQEYACMGDVIDIIACLSANSSSAAGIFIERNYSNLDDDDDISTDTRARFASREGDHVTLLRAWREYQSVRTESPMSTSAWCRKWDVNRRVMRAAEVCKKLRYSYSFISLTLQDIRTQLLQYAKRRKIDVVYYDEPREDHQDVLKAFLRGNVLNTALLQPDGKYRTVIGGQVGLVSSSQL